MGLRGALRCRAPVHSHWRTVKCSGIPRAGGYTVGGLKPATLGIFTLWKWANTMSQCWFFSPAGKLVYQHSSGSPSRWALCGDDGSWVRSLRFCQGSGQTGGISDLVGGELLHLGVRGWLWKRSPKVNENKRHCVQGRQSCGRVSDLLQSPEL